MRGGRMAKACPTDAYVNIFIDMPSTQPIIKIKRNMEKITKRRRKCPRCEKLKYTVFDRPDAYANDVGNDPDARMTCCDECAEQNALDI